MLNAFEVVDDLASQELVEQVLQILDQLLAMGFIKKNSDSYEYVQGATHTPKESPLVVLHHQNWRQRAVIDSQNIDSSGFHYTGVQSISFNDFKKIKSLLLHAITDLEKIAGPSIPQELVNINLDFYKV